MLRQLPCPGVLSAVLASLGFAVSLSLLNVDAAIVHHNVLRAAQGRHFNAAYLSTLTTDAIPALVEEFADASLPTGVHEGIGAALMCHYHFKSVAEDIAEDDPGLDDWRSFNLSDWNAEKAFAAVQSQLEGYHVNTNRYPARVRTPSNATYLCVDTEPSEED